MKSKTDKTGEKMCQLHSERRCLLCYDGTYSLDLRNPIHRMVVSSFLERTRKKNHREEMFERINRKRELERKNRRESGVRSCGDANEVIELSSDDDSSLAESIETLPSPMVEQFLEVQIGEPVRAPALVQQWTAEPAATSVPKRIHTTDAGAPVQEITQSKTPVPAAALHPLWTARPVPVPVPKRIQTLEHATAPVPKRIRTSEPIPAPSQERIQTGKPVPAPVLKPLWTAQPVRAPVLRQLFTTDPAPKPTPEQMRSTGHVPAPAQREPSATNDWLPTTIPNQALLGRRMTDYYFQKWMMSQKNSSSSTALFSRARDFGGGISTSQPPSQPSGNRNTEDIFQQHQIMKSVANVENNSSLSTSSAVVKQSQGNAFPSAATPRPSVIKNNPLFSSCQSAGQPRPATSRHRPHAFCSPVAQLRAQGKVIDMSKPICYFQVGGRWQPRVCMENCCSNKDLCETVKCYNKNCPALDGRRIGESTVGQRGQGNLRQTNLDKSQYIPERRRIPSQYYAGEMASNSSSMQSSNSLKKFPCCDNEVDRHKTAPGTSRETDHQTRVGLGESSMGMSPTLTSYAGNDFRAQERKQQPRGKDMKTPTPAADENGSHSTQLPENQSIKVLASPLKRMVNQPLMLRSETVSSSSLTANAPSSPTRSAALSSNTSPVIASVSSATWPVIASSSSLTASPFILPPTARALAFSLKTNTSPSSLSGKPVAGVLQSSSSGKLHSPDSEKSQQPTAHTPRDLPPVEISAPDIPQPDERLPPFESIGGKSHSADIKKYWAQGSKPSEPVDEQSLSNISTDFERTNNRFVNSAPEAPKEFPLDKEPDNTSGAIVPATVTKEGHNSPTFQDSNLTACPRLMTKRHRRTRKVPSSTPKHNIIHGRVTKTRDRRSDEFIVLCQGEGFKIKSSTLEKASPVFKDFADKCCDWIDIDGMEYRVFEVLGVTSSAMSQVLQFVSCTSYNHRVMRTSLMRELLEKLKIKYRLTPNLIFLDN